MESRFVKTDNPDFVKDQKTGALVSSDISAFNKFKAEQERIDQIKNQENDLNSIKSEVSELKNQISEITKMLQQLLNT